MLKKSNAALVVGSGVAGIQASLDLAESGYQVFLLDKNSTLGGKLPQLDKQFPGNDCGMCKMLPFSASVSQVCLKRGVLHPGIECILNGEVAEFSGSPGDFSVTISEHSQYVAREKCIGCGRCVDVCPVQAENEFDGSLSARKAIYVRCPTAIPNTYVVDVEQCTRCGECVKVCPTDAIDLSSGEKRRTLNVGAIILSPGFEEFNPTFLEEYGYARFSNVMTSTQFERALSGSGPCAGEFVRPSDNSVPQRIAFLQCVGSRDSERGYCSSACCMYAMKEATLFKEAHPDADVRIFFMDLRVFGKGCHRYYKDTEREGVGFVRCRVPAIEEDPTTRNLEIVYETERGKLVRDEFDLVVLSIGQCPPGGAEKLGEVFGIELNEYGFCKTKPLLQVETGKRGVYVCGSFREPVAIQEAVVQGSASASKAACLLRQEEVASIPAPRGVQRAEEELRTGIFICECGKEISSVIDTNALVEFANKLSGISVCERIDYLCLEGTLRKLEERASDARLNRILLAACAPYCYEPLFSKSFRKLGIEQHQIGIVDIREGVAWVHGNKVGATRKAKKLISMAYEKLKRERQLPFSSDSITPGVSVIGGGMSGLTSALSLAQRGVEVSLIETTAELGGSMKDMGGGKWPFAPAYPDVQRFLDHAVEDVEKNKRIRVYRNTEVRKVSGYAGNFSLELSSAAQEVGSSASDPDSLLQCGAIIVATGAKEYQPHEYSYGEHDRVVTQIELNRMLVSAPVRQRSNQSKNRDTGTLEDLKTVVMIQCVGSRDEEHPYCSRVCCTSAIENALKLKEKNPKTDVYILYRDIMSYGFREECYTLAREAGVFFIRYDLEELPKVNVEGKKLRVTVRDLILDELLGLSPDILVLSTGIVPNDNKALAGVLGVPLDRDGFFQEANTNFRPVDFTTPGIFVCGLAHSPMFIEEAISQANAVCGRAAASLSKHRLLSPRVVAEVEERLCTGCGLCVSVCPSNARALDEVTRDKKVAIVRESLCQGCGNCVVECLNSATRLRSCKNEQIFSMISAAMR